MSGAPAPQRRREGWRGGLVWSLGLVATLGLAILSALAGVILGVLGLGVVALVLSALLLAVPALWLRRLMLPAATLAVSLALPAAAVQQIETRIHPSAGALIVTPRGPSEVAKSTYTRGFGPVVIDLRRFRAPDRSTTKISARADDDRVVVALPRDRCFNLVVRYRVGDRWFSQSRELVRRAAALAGGPEYRNTSLAYRPMGVTQVEAVFQDTNVTGSRFFNLNPKLPVPDARVTPDKLLFFGTYPPTPRRAYRVATRRDAPTIQLDLRAGRQIVVRDYPEWAAPLFEELGVPSDQVAGMGWPGTLRAPLSPGERDWRLRPGVRTKLNRSRWVKWEREILDWGQQQAVRMAGPCANREELRRRAYSFYTQPEAFRTQDGRVRRLLGGPSTRHSEIFQTVAPRSSSVFKVEVNGLGQAKVVHAVDAQNIYADPTFTEVER